jgi:hypothetical protein
VGADLFDSGPGLDFLFQCCRPVPVPLPQHLLQSLQDFPVAWVQEAEVAHLMKPLGQNMLEKHVKDNSQSSTYTDEALTPASTSSAFITQANAEGAKGYKYYVDLYRSGTSSIYIGHTESPQTRNLTVTISGSGSVHGTSTQGQNYSCNNAACPSTPFAEGDQVNLTATPDWKSLFGSWSGYCSGSANPCNVTMTTDRNVNASFTPNLQVRVPTASTDYASIQDAYDHANTGSSILARVYTFYENLIFGRAVTVTIDGGKADNYEDTAGFTTVKGSLTLEKGTTIINNLIFL